MASPTAQSFVDQLLASAPTVTAKQAAAFFDVATSAHPKLKKPSPAAFAKLVAARLGEATLTQLRADDLYLASGALLADAAALTTFRALLARRVDDVVSSMRGPGTLRDEVEERLLEKMLVAPKGKPARLSTYGGRGDLGSWLGVAATRTAIELKRLKRYQSAADGEAEDEAGSGLQIAASDPELQLLQRSHASRFKQALHEAFEKLSVEERSLLRLQLADGLTVDQLATMFQIHRATAARRVAKAREELVREVRTVLSSRFRMTEDSIASDLKKLGGNLDLSLSRLLKTTTTAG